MPAEQDSWQLPAIGPEPALRVQAADPAGTASATAAQVCAFLCAQDRLHRERHQAPLASFTLEDWSLLEQPYRSAALWDRILEAQSQGALPPLKLTLDKVKPRQVPAAWFALAAKAGVAEIVLDPGPQRINDVCTLAVRSGIAPRVLLPLAGGFDLTESACRAVVILKGVLPWQAAPADMSGGVRLDLPSDLAAVVEQGTTDVALLGDLVLGPWFQYLPASNRRALFPVWMAAHPEGQIAGSGPGPEDALAGLNSQLKPAFTAWLRARASEPRRDAASA